MQELLVADRYAKGLLRVATEENIIDQLDVELKLFAAILKKQVVLPEVFRSPLVDLKAKQELLACLMEKQWISPQLGSFLYLLLEKRRFNLFNDITRIYKELIHTLRKKLKVFVESAFALQTQQKTALKDKLVKIYQRNIDLSVKVNPELIGGARVYLGHTLYDGTVTARLNFLKEQICSE